MAGETKLTVDDLHLLFFFLVGPAELTQNPGGPSDLVIRIQTIFHAHKGPTAV